MDIKSIIKKVLLSTCVFFTAITVLYCTLVAILNPDAKQILFEGTRIVLFFIFSLLVSLANAVLSVQIIPSVARRIIHYVLCAIAFYLCVLFPLVQAQTTASFIFVGLSLFTVLYVLTVVLINVIKSKNQRNKEKKETYTNQFSK